MTISKIEIPQNNIASKMREGNAILIDCFSATRNSMNTVAGFFTGTAEKVASAVGGLVMAGGILGLFSAAGIVTSGISGIKKAYKTKNREAGLSNLFFTTLGTAYGVVSAGMITTQAATYASAAAAAATGASVITGGVFALYGATGIYAAHGLSLASHFRHKLNQNNEDIHKAIEFLHDQIKKEENMSDETHQKKLDQFASRTSEGVLQEILPHLTDEFVTKVQSDNETTINLAKSIIREVKRANNKVLAKNTLLLVIAILGITSMIATLVFAGPLAPLLFAIGAVLWLFIDSSQLHQKFGDLPFGKFQRLDQTQQPQAPLPKEPQKELDTTEESQEKLNTEPLQEEGLDTEPEQPLLKEPQNNQGGAG